ncbi:hypothetical protein [Muribaculum intestinale]|uniref:hypothetical protein n=1 Tax=Muribaculum intestinale TaxID=1796646 RepID=UPI0026705CE7|nr:hypothetical protein [Muribaculum intestinale]
MALTEKIRKITDRIHLAVTSSRGREVGLFLLFLAISYIFWLLLTLNNESQDDIDVPIAIVNVPDSVTFITDVQPVIKASVRDKGSILMRYRFNNSKVMKIDWAEYVGRTDDNRFLMGRQDLGARLRDYFGSSSQIVTVAPDSLKLIYTTSPGRKVAVHVNADVRPALGNIVNGPLTINTDSVTLYSVTDMPHSLTSVETMPIIRSKLTDTTSVLVKIKPIDGVRIIPDNVTVTIPVEPLIARSQMASVVVKNMPHGYGLLTFPSQIEVSYLIPMSAYNTEPYDIKAYVDFADALSAPTSKIPVTMSLMPELYRDVTISPDSVEYIVEQRHQ